MEGGRVAQLISAMGHELRSPLTSVKGFSSTLLSRWDRFSDEQKLLFVETIHKDAERMARLVSDVLDLARLASDGLELYPTEVDVAAVAAEAVEKLGDGRGAARVALDVDDGLTAWVDAERLRQILGVVLETAAKFPDPRSIAVRGRRAGVGVEITVTEQGPGSSIDRVESLLAGLVPEPEGARPARADLGLYLAHRLVEAQGGTMSVDGVRDEEATFKIVLPARERAS